MKLTTHVINKIQIAMSAKGMTQADLARKIDYHRSHVSKILKGEVDSLNRELVDLLNDALGLDLDPMNYQQMAVSPAAMELSAMSEKDKTLASLLEKLVLVVRPTAGAFLPQVDTKRLPKIGAELTRIVHEWDQNADPHYSKIAVESLDFLRGYYMTESKKPKD